MKSSPFGLKTASEKFWVGNTRENLQSEHIFECSKPNKKMEKNSGRNG